MAGAIAGIVGSVVSSAVSSVVGNMMSSLISNFGSSNIAGAFANAFMGALGTALNSVIDNSPLPQFLKDAAKDVINKVIGSNQQATTPEAQDAVNHEYGDMIMENAQNMAEEAAKEAEGEDGGNWLVALAKALSQSQVKFLNDAMENQEIMKNSVVDTDAPQQEQEDTRAEFVSAQNEFTANMQMFNTMSTMVATSLKTVGEGLAAIARKQ